MPTKHPFGAIETVEIHPPVWCHGCGRMLTADGYLHGEAVKVTALCPDCATGRPACPGPERQQPSEQRVRELVEAARLLAESARGVAIFYEGLGAETSARMIRDLAAATDRAIEGLRQ